MNDIGLQNAIGAKIKYLTQSQAVISQNIANADTPGYRPQTLTPVDFSIFLGRAGMGAKVQMANTSPSHLAPGGGKPGEAKERRQRVTYEVAPAGNAVIMEEQLVNANAVRQDYALMTNLYQKNIQLLRTALGTNR